MCSSSREINSWATFLKSPNEARACMTWRLKPANVWSCPIGWPVTRTSDTVALRMASAVRGNTPLFWGAQVRLLPSLIGLERRKVDASANFSVVNLDIRCASALHDVPGGRRLCDSHRLHDGAHDVGIDP